MEQNPILKINQLSMAKETFTKAELRIVVDALEVYKGEIKKLWAKTEKLGLAEADSIKETFLQIESLRTKLPDNE